MSVPYFETVVNAGTLELHFQEGVSVSNNNVEVFVTMPELVSLRCSGSSDAFIRGPFNSDVLNVNVSGSGNVLIEGAAVNRFTLSVSGDGDLKAFSMVAVRADIDISGSGKTEITVTDELKVDISGSAVVYYKGSPSSVESSISGSGKLIHQQ